MYFETCVFILSFVCGVEWIDFCKNCSIVDDIWYTYCELWFRPEDGTKTSTYSVPDLVRVVHLSSLASDEQNRVKIAMLNKKLFETIRPIKFHLVDEVIIRNMASTIKNFVCKNRATLMACFGICFACGLYLFCLVHFRRKKRLLWLILHKFIFISISNPNSISIPVRIFIFVRV